MSDTHKVHRARWITELVGTWLQGTPTASIEDRVLAGRVNTLIRQQPMAMVANLVNSGLLALILYGAWPTIWLVVWVVVVWALTALRGTLWFRYRCGLAAPSDAKTGARLHTAFALASGIVWGAPVALFFPVEAVVLQGFIVFVLGGMSAGAVSTLASHLPAFRCFIVPALLPIIGRLIIEGGVLYVAMGLMGLIYFLVLMVTGQNLNRTLTQSLTLQIEKSDLVESLTAAQAQAEAANVAKSAFLATVSHELRTPLNAVLGFTQLLEQEVHGPLGHDKYREYLDHMKGSGDHLLSLIDELLDLSRAEAGHLVIRREETVDLTAELKQCVALLAARCEQRDIGLRVSIAETIPLLWSDPQRLRQIVLNVLSNAIKFSADGAKVELTAKQETSGALIIAVRDTGIGMSADDLSTALEFFGRADNSRSRATEGAGIGLPLTGLLMQLHGGEMDIASEPRQGTTVTLRFPAERVIEDKMAEPPREGPAGDERYGSTPAA